MIFESFVPQQWNALSAAVISAASAVVDGRSGVATAQADVTAATGACVNAETALRDRMDALLANTAIDPNAPTTEALETAVNDAAANKTAKDEALGAAQSLLAGSEAQGTSALDGVSGAIANAR